jgi:hypothetical protein
VERQTTTHVDEEKNPHMPKKTSWTIASLFDDKHLENGAKLLKTAGKDDYPREANWVHLLANTIEQRERNPLLEVPYWRAYQPRPTRGWPKADLWVPATDKDYEVWPRSRSRNCMTIGQGASALNPPTRYSSCGQRISGDCSSVHSNANPNQQCVAD